MSRISSKLLAIFKGICVLRDCVHERTTPDTVPPHEALPCPVLVSASVFSEHVKQRDMLLYLYQRGTTSLCLCVDGLTRAAQVVPDGGASVQSHSAKYAADRGAGGAFDAAAGDLTEGAGLLGTA